MKLLNVPSFLLDEAGCLGACNRQLRINRKIGKFQISKHEGGGGGGGGCVFYNKFKNGLRTKL